MNHFTMAHILISPTSRSLKPTFWLTITLSTGLLASQAVVTSAQAADVPDYNREVRPILAEHCFQCHGADQKDRQGGLRLDELETAQHGGESGQPAITPGDLAHSQMVDRITSNDSDVVMPPPRTKKPLDTKKIDTLKRWIAGGAPYARHWSFNPPKKMGVPAGTNPIDALVQRQLTGLGLTPNEPAVAATLCRRIYLDVIGLPPAPAEVTSFEQAYRANAKQAISDLVDRLLAMPQYGEKWGRHWLDVARYSDSNGFEKDLPREQWAWRDWVIRSLNNDLPYDQFLVEQLAGDLLPGATQDQLIATGFLRNSMINEEGAIVPEQFRMDEMFDRMDCIGKATIGLSLQCAQCHSHKFDPISHDDYFGIFAFFNNTYEAQSWVYTPEQLAQLSQQAAARAAVEERLKAARPDWASELEAWSKEVLAKEVDWQPIKPFELESNSGLNHPILQPDASILTLGHPTTNGDIYVVAEVEKMGVTGLRLEALTHGDLPHRGPGRSKLGTFAISEMKVETQGPGQTDWKQQPMVNATADFSEPDGPLEPMWNADYDPDKKRTRGPVSHLIDGNMQTGWRGDRGPGLRNQAGVAIVQFPQPLDLPTGSKVRVTLTFNHGGSDNGRHNVMLGCCRIGLTSAPAPAAQPVDYQAILALKKPVDQRTAQDQQAIFSAWRSSLTDEPSKAINIEIANLYKGIPEPLTSILHVAERSPEQTRQTYLLDRGSWDRPTNPIEPAFPAAFHQSTGSDRVSRLDFARWIVSPKSPLTNRVAVNRIWQSLFGTGIVETSEDFGTRTAVPEQLEVLDWLAVDFAETGYSQKKLIKSILTSATYLQSSNASKEKLDKDPRNRFLSRGPRFRLEAEVLRDTALTIAGLMHPQVGGPSLFAPVPQSVLDYNYFKPTYWNPPTGPDRYRRSMYMFRKRSMPDPVLSNFDAPNGDFSCARRVRSNTPLSALTSLNETVFVEAAQALAIRILKEGGETDGERADYAYRLCTSRPITKMEQKRVLELLSETKTRLKSRELVASEIAYSPFTKLDAIPADATPNEIAAWTVIGRVLLNLDETITKN